jgi:hypothetical protein
MRTMVIAFDATRPFLSAERNRRLTVGQAIVRYPEPSLRSAMVASNGF